MPQKYTFFVKDRVVELVQISDFTASNPATLSAILQALDPAVDSPPCCSFSVANAESTFRSIAASIHLIRAGGGYVINDKEELLMIYRRGSWDLPKGKQEDAETIEETALREVKEETGVEGLEIKSAPFRTYHLYREKGNVILKESVWFAMSAPDQPLVPQSEEDIEEALWIKLPVNATRLEQAYASIREVVKHFSGVDQA